MRAARRPVLVLCATALLVACSEPSGGALPAEDAVMCRELGGGVVHIRYETEAGLAVRNQHGIDHDRAQAAGGISEQAARVLEVRGWSEEAMAELGEPRPLSAETAALLAEMPSCLAELRQQPSVDEAPSIDGSG